MKERKRKMVIVVIIVVLLFVVIGVVLANTKKNSNINDINDVEDKKPIIYLYPEKDMNVVVKLGYEDKLTTTYPKYKGSWNVYAKHDGSLIDLSTGRSLYALYWEGKNTVSQGIRDEGFVVKGEDTIKFLEEKLEILGLNDREAEEFIVYWLPKMEHNNYNYIRFETMEEINSNMPLYVNPKPDCIIRIMMEFKKLNKEINVEEQKLDKIERHGFSVIEWGGSELK